MNSRWLFGLLAIYISGCAYFSPLPQKGQPMAWDKQGISDNQKQHDKYECEKDAQQASKDTGLQQVQIYLRQLADCYAVKGYTVTKRQE